MPDPSPAGTAAPDLVTLAEIREAAARISGVAVRTPLLPAGWAGDLLLKAENLQPVGAFKIRGAYAKLSGLSAEQRARGVVTHSSGNHAQAVAYAAKLLGIAAVVVMPDTAPAAKIAATRGHGAEVVLVAPERRDEVADALARERGLVPAPPYDDRTVIAGQATVGVEIVEDAPGDVTAVLAPVSGGGLVSGVAAAVKLLRPAIRVIGVEPELAADATESMRRGERVAWRTEDVQRTVADGLRVTPLGALPWLHMRAHVDAMVTVTDGEIVEAVRLLAARSRLVVEPSGAVTTAAHLFRGSELPAGRRVAVVSGGNMDPEAFARILTGS